MSKNKLYQIENFYVGELYLYTAFGNLLTGNPIVEGREKLESFSKTGAIDFQKNYVNKYIDLETKREYNGFLTIFYKQENKLICLHDGKTYDLVGSYIIDNLVPLNELLPKVDNINISKISMIKALQLFNTLFKSETQESWLYQGNEFATADYYVGDLSLKEQTPITPNDSRIKYIDLPQHIMLGRTSTEICSYGSDNYVNTVYRCLFLRDGVDLYNLHNHQFYNPHEDKLDRIITFSDYNETFGFQPIKDKISIPKALRLFKKTL